MNPIIRNKLESMRSDYENSSFKDVQFENWINLEEITLNGKKYWPSIWAQQRPDDSWLLVVQLTRWMFLRMIGSTNCIGILFHPSGEKEFVDEMYLMNEEGHP
jgi:hypothetical protein